MPQHCAVVVVPDAKWGEAVNDVVRRKAAGNCTAEGIVRGRRGPRPSIPQARLCGIQGAVIALSREIGFLNAGLIDMVKLQDFNAWATRVVPSARGLSSSRVTTRQEQVKAGLDSRGHVLDFPGRHDDYCMTMLKKHNPASIVKPFAAYSQGVEVPPNARWLYIAGQVGVNADGTVAGDTEKQVERAWQNVLAVLSAANMGPEDLVHVNVYITDPADVRFNRESWRNISQNGGPGITMVTVKRLSHPDWTVEIEAVAARA